MYCSEHGWYTPEEGCRHCNKIKEEGATKKLAAIEKACDESWEKKEP